MRPTRHRSRFAAFVATAAVLAGLAIAPGIAHAATPPPNPTDNQINTAAEQKAALADKVGSLGAQIASIQTQLQQLQANQELAEQKVAYAYSKLDDAKSNAAAAKADVGKAEQNVNAAQASLRAYAQATFMTGDIGGNAGSLLTAQDPSALLQQSALQSYEADHQVNAIAQMQTATVAKSNADASARKAVVAQKVAAANATAAKNAADSALNAAQIQSQQLNASLASTQTALADAQSQLATLNHQRAQYNAYVVQQRAIAAAKARAARIAAAKARAARIEAAKKAAAAAAAAAAARKHHHSGGGSSSGGGGSSSGGGGGGGGGSSSSPTGGSWSLARGEAAVAKAKQYLGWMYAWAGGNRNGPTYGVCESGDAFNDCHIVGFDCSGLALYAWGDYIDLDHYAAAQYSQAGSYHPSTSHLEPGDLTFWSSNGTQSGIHHVAIYVGNGDVIQAPESGETIRITPLDQVDWGYYGATRPLT
ncbi:NlpC/P60 family protein [Jatrophihabitans sp.]|uniref:C40 family peptidase n=1 Tax=Jatrophihabitans sp. TaxID=1932789 RepID=UPI0030C75B03